MAKKIAIFCLMVITYGCATGKVAIKPTPGTEVVEAEGQAPIIKEDLVGAKNTALSEAQRAALGMVVGCLLYTSPSPRDRQKSRMPSSA